MWLQALNHWNRRLKTKIFRCEKGENMEDIRSEKAMKKQIIKWLDKADYRKVRLIYIYVKSFLGL